MFDFMKKKLYPTGVDLGSGHIKMAQLGFDGEKIFLNAAACERRPDDITPGTGNWQRWVAKTVKNMITSNPFKGKAVTTAMPCDDVFIDQIRISRSHGNSLEVAALEKVQSKLPFDHQGALIKCVVTDNVANMDDLDVVVMVAERENVNRNLAIYEKAGLQMKSISVWPLAITNSYTTFFGRRDADVDVNVLLMEVGANHSNIVISRNNDLLFARAISVGSKKLDENPQQVTENLIAEATSCCRYFETVSGGSHIQRLVFLARQDTDPRLCQGIADFAQRMQVAAQIGDVFAAVEPGHNKKLEIDERLLHVDWSTAFGLSLATAKELQTA